MTYYGYIDKATPFTKETFFLYLKNTQLRWAEFKVWIKLLKDQRKEADLMRLIAAIYPWHLMIVYVVW